jgi:DNA-binding LacI/PurR family transcriptional regulator
VAVLSPVPLHAVDPRVLYWIDELRTVLAGHGCHLDFVHQANVYSEHPHHALAELTARQPSAAWLLYLSTRALQEWFVRHGLPAIVAGSRYPDLALPSVDVNYRAACRHAGNQFIKRGHRVLALLNPRSAAGGDLASEAGFHEAAQAAGREVEVIVARHDGSVKDLCARLDALLARAHRPTAFLVSRPAHAVTTVSHLVRRGLRFPNDAMLIARDHDLLLEPLVPTVARYQIAPGLFARKISRVVLELVSGGRAQPRDYRIIPQLIPGETLG